MNRLLGISEDLLSNGFDLRINTRGPSMFPLIGTGDKITISTIRNPKIGDILVFRRDDQMVCHRLVKAFERNGTRHFQTRGDSFFNPDEPVTADQILGRVIRIERGRIPLVRRILLFAYPVLRYGRLNGMVISALTMARSILKRLPYNTA